MKDEKEIQTAWEIWILINRLNDLLFDRYEEEFPDIWLNEQEDKFSPTIGLPSLTKTQDETEG
jgi:hypothetical protein